MELQTPILFLVFNRPEHTTKVFAQIRKVKPKYLYIAADGPRSTHPEDFEKCANVREIVSHGIDWNCEIKTLFREQNLGCGHGPANAITWFFENVEEGIILEDDCFPSVSFFMFCEIMLKRYRNEHQIMAISGYNYLGEWQNEVYDYFFSDGGNWGWASWRRAWNFFDFKLKSWQSISSDAKIRIMNFYPDFENLYKKIVIENYDAWDIQWHYSRLYYNGLSITPSSNLVQNIGFDEQGSHTKTDFSSFSNLRFKEMDFSNELKGPKELKLDIEFRQALLRKVNGKKSLTDSFFSLILIVVNKIRSYLR